MNIGGFTRGNPNPHWHSISTTTDGFLPPQMGSDQEVTWYSANGAIYAPVMVRAAVVVKKLWVGVGSTGTGNVDIGLFDSSGVKLTSSGATAHGSTEKALVCDVTDATISPGIYYIGVSASNATDTFVMSLASAPNMAAYGCYTEASAHALPATATFAVAQTLGQMPVAGALLNTVVS